VRFPAEEVLACILERAKEPLKLLKLPPMDAEEAWVLTEFLDEVQEAIWMDYGDEISDYLDSMGAMDCFHAAEDAAEDTTASDSNQDIEF
jgi:peptide subunit release factor 1 (eRF1)